MHPLQASIRRGGVHPRPQHCASGLKAGEYSIRRQFECQDHGLWLRQAALGHTKALRPLRHARLLGPGNAALQHVRGRTGLLQGGGHVSESRLGGRDGGQVNGRLIGVHFRLIRRWACGVIMFTLLVGCPPFWHRKQMVMLRNIMEGKYSFTSPEWAEISGECSYSWYSSLGQPNVCNNNRKSSLKAQVWIKTEIPRVLQRIPRI